MYVLNFMKQSFGTGEDVDLCGLDFVSVSPVWMEEF